MLAIGFGNLRFDFVEVFATVTCFLAGVFAFFSFVLESDALIRVTFSDDSVFFATVFPGFSQIK